MSKLSVTLLSITVQSVVTAIQSTVASGSNRQ